MQLLRYAAVILSVFVMCRVGLVSAHSEFTSLNLSHESTLASTNKSPYDIVDEYNNEKRLGVVMGFVPVSHVDVKLYLQGQTTYLYTTHPTLASRLDQWQREDSQRRRAEGAERQKRRLAQDAKRRDREEREARKAEAARKASVLYQPIRMAKGVGNMLGIRH
eukprot:GFYU01032432.1.p2 GENE.GFYU01032432.1~~GFYU01032432.1.p2  ORF type:complete len:174 (-),score=11.17 GFYU01032432.1:147-635(-)